MITIVKLNPQGQTQIRYQGDLLARRPNGMVIEAYWTQPLKDLGYTQFATGDRFIEHYYTDCWFNIFDISSADGVRKGWYCNVAEPAHILDDSIEQVDLLLDLWVDPQGHTLILDEDEFHAATTLSHEQRFQARQALQTLLQMVAHQKPPFS